MPDERQQRDELMARLLAQQPATNALYPQYKNALAASLAPKRPRNALMGAVSDPLFWKRDVLGRASEAAQGMAAGVLGAPVDLVSTVMRPFGYNVPSESVVGSSDWFGKLMGANRDSISYQAGQFGPVPDATDAMRLAAQIDPQMLSGLLSGMTAFHGSPHKFDKFDVSKIGTGEGVQAFGHGLYFAENPNVARDYQRTLARDDGGAFYEVDIPDDAIAKMIDWDDILSEQPKEIQELAALWGLQGKSGADVFGRDVVKEAARRSGGPRGASELFRNLGIPGIRYWDAGSRASEVGTRNFVVFDDSLVRILRRE